ncbi:MAG: chorismate mutase [Coriobacteriia bacterium]|nr:chorismate mutase [Coriobacteriia bacterium]
MAGNKDISDKRGELDELDEALLRILNKRAELSLKIRDLKIKSNFPLYDAKREEEILNRLCEKNDGPLYDDDVRHLYSEILKVMRGLPNE